MRSKIYEGREPYVFVSYAHKDAAVVLPAIEALQDNGFRVWYDRGIEAGTEWPEYIAEHLENADSVIVFMSEAAAESRNCRREINFSIDIGKEPLVVYIEDVKLSAGMKLQLNTLQALFMYRSKTQEEFMQELCKARLIENCRENKPEPTATAAQPKAAPVNTPPVVNAAPVVEAIPVKQTPPVVNAVPVINATPVANTPPAAKTAPATKTGPVANAAPVAPINTANYGQPTQNAAKSATANKTSASLVLGILGIVFAWLLAILGHILSIVGIVMGVKEYKTTGKSTGLVLSIIGEVCAIISSIIGAAMAAGSSYY